MSDSIAKGSPLTQETWVDFVARLHHDCVGAGVDRHFTRDALFVVEEKVYDYGIDTDYGGEPVIVDDDRDDEFDTANAYYVESDKDIQHRLDDAASEYGYVGFLAAPDYTQFDIIEDVGCARIVGRKERWQYVNSHFTRDAAEAFIARKKHDYRRGLRVNVDAQLYCWEFNAIKEAILAGKLVYVGL